VVSLLAVRMAGVVVARHSMLVVQHRLRPAGNSIDCTHLLLGLLAFDGDCVAQKKSVKHVLGVGETYAMRSEYPHLVQ
jgi:hypothetical protein